MSTSELKKPKELLDVAKIRTALADYFRNLAQWRRSKQEQYPMDGRNGSAVSSLDQVAAHIEGLPDGDKTLQRFQGCLFVFHPGGDVFTPPYARECDTNNEA